MQVSFATDPGSASRPNEDFAAATPCVAVVLDGLTAPPELDTGCVHGTPWYVAQLGTRLLQLAATSPTTPLTEVTADAIATTAAAHRSICDLSHPGTPCSTVVLLRESTETVEHLLLFDSVLVLDGPSGVQAITDDRILQVAQSERADTRHHPIGTAEHARSVERLVDAERQHRNQPGGYWVAGSDPIAAQYAVTGSLPRDEVNRAALLSDGASCLVDIYAGMTWSDAPDLLHTTGPSTFISRVRELEATDPDGRQWPRYKPSDDATALYCQLTDSSPQTS